MTKLIFMGTPQFSVPILEALVAQAYDVVAVVTQPDRPVGRKRVITPTPVKEAAIRLGLPVFQPEKISGSPEMAEIMALEADIIVTAAFGQFLPEALFPFPQTLFLPFRSLNRSAKGFLHLYLPGLFSALKNFRFPSFVSLALYFQ